ncbi:MAG TPA: ABC transporter ATP-binding protein [Bacillales bacterium]|nr:ABC transporter ATP-binding protein [Bacillales bacterium]
MVLQVQKISKRFGGISALTDVSFSVKEGEVFGLIGPNGAGKTTMFNIITAVFAPTEGEVAFGGETISGKKPHQITKKGICRTFQNIRLFDKMTVLENVMTGAHARSQAGVWGSVWRTKAQRREERELREKAAGWLETVGLGGVEDVVAENLAYGQQRKLEIARALASEPKLLLLDEPAAGMNEAETEELQALIKKIQALGKTIVLIEHDMPLVMAACDRIAVLNFGEKIAEGEPEAIQNHPDVIEAYLGNEGDGDGDIA